MMQGGTAWSSVRMGRQLSGRPPACAAAAGDFGRRQGQDGHGAQVAAQVRAHHRGGREHQDQARAAARREREGADQAAGVPAAPLQRAALLQGEAGPCVARSSCHGGGGARGAALPARAVASEPRDEGSGRSHQWSRAASRCGVRRCAAGWATRRWTGARCATWSRLASSWTRPCSPCPRQLAERRRAGSAQCLGAAAAAAAASSERGS